MYLSRARHSSSVPRVNSAEHVDSCMIRPTISDVRFLPVSMKPHLSSWHMPVEHLIACNPFLTTDTKTLFHLGFHFSKFYFYQAMRSSMSWWGGIDWHPKQSLHAANPQRKTTILGEVLVLIKIKFITFFPIETACKLLY